MIGNSLQFQARDTLLIRKLLHYDHSSVSWFTNEAIRKKIRIAIFTKSDENLILRI